MRELCGISDSRCDSQARDLDFDHPSGIPMGPCLASDARSDGLAKCPGGAFESLAATAGLPLSYQPGVETGLPASLFPTPAFSQPPVVRLQQIGNARLAFGFPLQSDQDRCCD